MATDKDLVIKITAETDKAIKEIKKLTTEVKKFSKVDDTVNKTTKSTDKLNTGFTKLSTSMKGMIGGAAALGIAMKALEFKDMAADAEQSADAFNRIFTEMGENADESFEKIKEASKGLIPDSSIKQASVTAVSLGVPIEKLAELMEVARVKAREMGTTAESAFNDLATGIGRGSPMILDNLGLTIKLEEANKKLANELGKTVEELTKEEKALALTNEVIEAGAKSVERYGDAQLTAKQKSQQFDAAVVKLKEKIGGALLPAMTSLTEATTGFINAIVEDDKAVKGLDDIKKKVTEIQDSMLDGKPKAVTEQVKWAVERGFSLGVQNGVQILNEETGKIDDISFTARPDVDVDAFNASWKEWAEEEKNKSDIKTRIDFDGNEIKDTAKSFMTVLNKETGKLQGVEIKAGLDTVNSIKTINGDTKKIEKDLTITPLVLIDENETKKELISTIEKAETGVEAVVDLKYDELTTLKDFVEEKQREVTPVIVPVTYVPTNAPTGLTETLSEELERGL